MTEFPLQFVRGLHEDNPWWKTPRSKQEIPDFKRSEYFHFIEETQTPSVHVLIGSRRVGKTTVIDQIIQFLIEEKGVDPKRILFTSLERPYFELVAGKLITAIDFFEQNIYAKPLSQSAEMIYLFIDEAQYDPIWTRILKQYCDQKRKIFAIVSGSSSTALYRDTAESGAGRFDSHQMMTMKFRDVLRLRIRSKDKEIYLISKELRQAFVLACQKKDPSVYLKTAPQVLARISALPIPIEGILEEYLLKGGYPEFYTNSNWKQVSSFYQCNVFDAILQKDVVNVFNLKFPQRIRKLLVQVLELSGSVLSRQKLAESLLMPGRFKTLDQYIESLSEAFLIRTSIKYRSAKGRPSTKEKKFFAADIGLRNSVLGIEHGEFVGHEKGEIIETVVFNHTLRLAFHIDRQIRTHGYYWTPPTGQGERDIILDLRRSNQVAIPIEVKSGQCSNSDIKKIKATMLDISAPFGVMTCKDRLGLQDGVLIVPTWMFLLGC